MTLNRLSLAYTSGAAKCCHVDFPPSPWSPTSIYRQNITTVTAQNHLTHFLKTFCSKIKKLILSVFEIFRSYKMTTVLKFHKLSENAMTPIRGSEFSAGLDLFAAEAKVIASKGRALVKTDLQVALPDGCYGRIAPRSGLAYKKVKFHLIEILEHKSFDQSENFSKFHFRVSM